MERKEQLFGKEKSNFLGKIKAISGKEKVIVGKEIVSNICDFSGKGKSNLRERTKLNLEMLGKGKERK